MGGDSARRRGWRIIDLNRKNDRPNVETGRGARIFSSSIVDSMNFRDAAVGADAVPPRANAASR